MLDRSVYTVTPAAAITLPLHAQLAAQLGSAHSCAMEWSDDAIILGSRRHGEGSALVEAMTANHGRHLGLVRGARSQRLAPIIQLGNRVRLVWRARLDEHLGQFAVEPVQLRAGSWMIDALALHGLNHLADLVRLLPEREPQPGMFDAMLVVLDHLENMPVCGPLLVRFELALLVELGFGLDLNACAVTGATQELRYVSPKSGRAVSAKAGADYADRLLRLPGFLGGSVGHADAEAAMSDNALRDGFALTGHFLERNVYGPRGMPPPVARERLVAALMTV